MNVHSECHGQVDGNGMPCVCVCVCVCERERGMEERKGREGGVAHLR